MVRNPVIERYLKVGRQNPESKSWKQIKKDLKPLVGLINRSGGEYSFQLRENYFNIYYQGNSLAKVTPNKNGTYSAEIHEKFLQPDEPDRILKKLEQYGKRNERKSSDYLCFRIESGELYHFFQNNHLEVLTSNIRARGYGEEITFEQVLITDNPPSRKFIIIDRQVADHKDKAQMDLLALSRDSENKPFHFLIIEVKLGRNPELHGEVGGQLNRYVRHVREYIKEYVTCYKENYRQKKELGLFDPFSPDLPAEIEIDESENSVEGLIVVGGYSQLGKQALENFRQKIKQEKWDIKVQQMRREIRLDNRSDCQEP
ncbi:MAG: hypothetical protein FJ012_10970 [Chloroflexi bacterium]|nr:hypothetical protein [Chloroflexota bacterium]